MSGYDGYSYHELVTPTSTDEGYADPIELLVCDRCGSVVRGISVDTHNDWHAATHRSQP